MGRAADALLSPGQNPPQRCSGGFFCSVGAVGRGDGAAERALEIQPDTPTLQRSFIFPLSHTMQTDPQTPPTADSQTGEGTPHQELIPEPVLGDELAQAREEISTLNDQLLRARAEVENIRRRAEDETAKARKFAVEGFAESLLPVKDSLEAALADTSGKPEVLKQGVELTLSQLKSAFERNRLVEISPAAGDKFDPALHQAISVQPAQQPAGTVVSVLQKGYRIADRTLRPALITVAQ